MPISVYGSLSGVKYFGCSIVLIPSVYPVAKLYH
jgi:hypothetical protein